MSRLYKVVFTALILFLILLNFGFVVYNQKIASVLRFDVDIESPEEIMRRTEERITGSIVLDANHFDNPKFLNLKDFSADLTGFNIPGGLIDDELEEDGDVWDDDQDDVVPYVFEVGNDNPFKPFN